MTAPKGNKRALGNPGGGRPTVYKPEYCQIAHDMCLLGGATDVKLADRFGVNESTITDWKRVHPEFFRALRNGKDGADEAVVVSLWERAKGYSHDDVDIRTVALGNNQGSEIVQTPIRKHYPPDTAAASLWLRNRQPKFWREKTDVEVTGPNGGPVQQVNMTPSEFAEIAKATARDI